MFHVTWEIRKLWLSFDQALGSEDQYVLEKQKNGDASKNKWWCNEQCWCTTIKIDKYK